MVKSTAVIGILSVTIFVIALLFFGTVHPKWSFFNSYISELGAKGAPLAWWWNLIGFVLVGGLLLLFGYNYGRLINDGLAGILLSLFGLGFAFTAIPIDELNSSSSVSKAHVVAICLALASWLFGLARISYNPSLDRKIKLRANVTATLLVVSVVGLPLGIWSMPLTHRLVFIIVFGWTVVSSIDLLRVKKS